MLLKLERLSTPYILVPCASAPGHQAALAVTVRSNYALSLDVLPADGSALPSPGGRLDFEMEEEEGDDDEAAEDERESQASEGTDGAYLSAAYFSGGALSSG